jgi:calcium-dependent protein kinase
LANRLEDGKSFAVKAFSKEAAYGTERGKESIKNEIQLMRELDHPSIIRLHEVYETQNSLYMIMDLLEGGSLYDKIKVGIGSTYLFSIVRLLITKKSRF